MDTGHLCGRTDCAGEEAHRHPYFVQSVFPHVETKPSADPHPAIVRGAGRERYDTWTGDNTVFVEFADGKRAIFPGFWLREQAEVGDVELAAVFEKHRRKREEENHRRERERETSISLAIEDAAEEMRAEVARCNAAEGLAGDGQYYTPRFDFADARPILRRLVDRILGNEQFGGV